MAKSDRNILAILAVGILISSAILAVVEAGVEFDTTGLIGSGSGSGSCKGTVGECMGMRSEMEMDSEINRRILATSNYISYNALNKDRVPCSKRGQSYYNCQPGASANPYKRGCSQITRCQR